MPNREDLAYKSEVIETQYMYTSAADIDAALDKAHEAIHDARKFRDVARATGTDVVKYRLSTSKALLFFVMGALACLCFLLIFGVI